MGRWYRLGAAPNPGCGRPGALVPIALIREAIEQCYKEDIEAAIDRAIVEGYTRIPPDGELDVLHDELARRSIAEEPW